jgi:hypothetical protein
MRVVADLERFAATDLDETARDALQETRIALSKAVTKMDSLETSFDRIAERSCTYQRRKRYDPRFYNSVHSPTFSVQYSRPQGFPCHGGRVSNIFHYVNYGTN